MSTTIKLDENLIGGMSVIIELVLRDRYAIDNNEPLSLDLSERDLKDAIFQAGCKIASQPTPDNIQDMLAEQIAIFGYTLLIQIIENSTGEEVASFFGGACKSYQEHKKGFDA